MLLDVCSYVRMRGELVGVRTFVSGDERWYGLLVLSSSWGAARRWRGVWIAVRPTPAYEEWIDGPAPFTPSFAQPPLVRLSLA